jgi:hypothetical protein
MILYGEAEILERTSKRAPNDRQDAACPLRARGQRSTQHARKRQFAALANTPAERQTFGEAQWRNDPEPAARSFPASNIHARRSPVGFFFSDTRLPRKLKSIRKAPYQWRRANGTENCTL